MQNAPKNPYNSKGSQQTPVNFPAIFWGGKWAFLVARWSRKPALKKEEKRWRVELRNKA